jgi:hypothetical protein
VAWKVELNRQTQEWYGSLDPRAAHRFAAALDRLQERGPGLGRPFADGIKGSRHHNMKELRAGSMRALYAFDPRRHAVVLLAGDKANDWSGWYRRNIPVADRRYDQHLRTIGGGERNWVHETGTRSVTSGR